MATSCCTERLRANLEPSATGGMILGTLIDELHRTGGRYGLATLCVGGGMAIATIVEAI